MENVGSNFMAYYEIFIFVCRKYTEKVQHHVCYGSQFLDAEPELHSSEFTSNKLFKFIFCFKFCFVFMVRVVHDHVLHFNFSTVPGICENSRLLRKQFLEEHEQALELEKRRLSELEIAAAKPLSHHSYFGYSLDELKRFEGLIKIIKINEHNVIFFFFSYFSHYFKPPPINYFSFSYLAHVEQMEFPSAERFNYLLDVLNNGSTSDDKVRHINTKYNDQERCVNFSIFSSYFIFNNTRYSKKQNKMNT